MESGQLTRSPTPTSPAGNPAYYLDPEATSRLRRIVPALRYR
ncbi:MAG: hypothetical protein ACLSHC_17620 [Bilophila wadsworthia]